MYEKAIDMICHHCGKNTGFPFVSVHIDSGKDWNGWWDKEQYAPTSSRLKKIGEQLPGSGLSFCNGKCLGKYVDSAKTKIKDAFYEKLKEYEKNQENLRNRGHSRTLAGAPKTDVQTPRSK